MVGFDGANSLPTALSLSSPPCSLLVAFELSSIERCVFDGDIQNVQYGEIGNYNFDNFVLHF